MYSVHFGYVIEDLSFLSSSATCHRARQCRGREKDRCHWTVYYPVRPTYTSYSAHVFLFVTVFLSPFPVLGKPASFCHLLCILGLFINFFIYYFVSTLHPRLLSYIPPCSHKTSNSRPGEKNIEKTIQKAKGKGRNRVNFEASSFLILSLFCTSRTEPPGTDHPTYFRVVSVTYIHWGRGCCNTVTEYLRIH